MIHAKFRRKLPQLGRRPFLTDGGLETTLVFHEGFDLPLFAAFPLVHDAKGREALSRYMRTFGAVAVRHGKGFVMDTPTWRASARWAKQLGFSEASLKQIHIDSLILLDELREDMETPFSPFVINGVLGPQDDGYDPGDFMTVSQARDYHAQQANWFAELGADMISAITMTYVEEATGIALAARDAGIPSVISFTVETDGRLPSGQPLGDAISQVDAETGSAPAYFMINCAHPDHFAHVLDDDANWRERIMGLRANASRMSHAELDQAEELDDGDPYELGHQYHDLMQLLPNLTVLGGCCGTDHRHVEAISAACGLKRAA